MFHIFTAASCKQFQHNSINIRHDATPMMPAMRTPRCPSLHAVFRAHFHTVLQLQSQIHQGTSVREWNWLRKNHAGWLNGQTEYPLSFKRVPMNTITIIIILCAYAMRAGGDHSLSVIGLTIYLNWKRELTSLFFTDLSHFRWRNSREAAALPDWRDAKHVYHDQEVCREFGQSSCLSYARGHLSTAHR